MTSRFDRDKAAAAIQAWLLGNEDERLLLDILAACVTPDRRIAAISALCKQGEPYGYVRIDAIRDVLNGGS